MKHKLTYERLHEVLDYNPKTGIFVNKITKNHLCKKGDTAGCVDNGYIRIKIDGKLYLAHRLAWFYVHGYFPENYLDHKDTIRHHNWIDNLREASNQCNQRNCGNPKDNKSGVKGVIWKKSNKKWMAYLRLNNKTKYLGYYKHFHNAVCARLAGEQCLGWEGCDSSSPSFQYVQKMLRGKSDKL